MYKFLAGQKSFPKDIFWFCLCCFLFLFFCFLAAGMVVFAVGRFVMCASFFYFFLRGGCKKNPQCLNCGLNIFNLIFFFMHFATTGLFHLVRCGTVCRFRQGWLWFCKRVPLSRGPCCRCTCLSLMLTCRDIFLTGT